MATDREHIATLERMLDWSQREVRNLKGAIEEYRILNVTIAAVELSQRSLERCQAEAEALEWALEKLTRSK
jgi:hypothetical protein